MLRAILKEQSAGHDRRSLWIRLSGLRTGSLPRHPSLWGRLEEALEALADAARFSNNNTKTIALRGYIYALSDRRDAAREILQVLEALARERYVAPYCIALVQLGLGEQTAALDALELAFAMRDTHLIFLPIDAKWDAL